MENSLRSFAVLSCSYLLSVTYDVGTSIPRATQQTGREINCVARTRQAAKVEMGYTKA